MPPVLSLPPLVRGGKRVEHPLARAPIVSPYSVTQGYRWIGDAQLPPGEKALLLTIFKLVDSRSWRWPPKTDDRGGSAVADLALAIERSERQTRRLIRALESRGVLAVADLRPFRSHYQILPDGLKALGELGRAVALAARKERKERRLAAARDADAALDADTAVAVEPPATPAKDLHEGPDTHREAPPAPSSHADDTPHPGHAAAPSIPPRAEALPAWAEHTARRAHLPAALVAGLVRAAWRAAGGGQGTWLHEGALARPALRAWRELDRPAPARWAALLDGLAAAKEGGRLRGSFPRGWTWTPRGALELLRLPWARLLAENEATAAERAPHAAPRTAAAPATMQVAGPVSANPADPARWASGIAALREKVGQTEAAVWLDPLGLDGVDDGHVVVRCPGAIHASWCAENYGPELVAAAGGPVRLVAAA
jgi:hypothetical protein